AGALPGRVFLGLLDPGRRAASPRLGGGDEGLARLDRHPVAALVLGVLAVPADPVEPQGVPLAQVVEDAPEVLVLDGLLVSRAPAPPDPVVHPLPEPLQDILAVGGDVD